MISRHLVMAQLVHEDIDNFANADLVQAGATKAGLETGPIAFLVLPNRTLTVGVQALIHTGVGPTQ